MTVTISLALGHIAMLHVPIEPWRSAAKRRSSLCWISSPGIRQGKRGGVVAQRVLVRVKLFGLPFFTVKYTAKFGS